MTFSFEVRGKTLDEIREAANAVMRRAAPGKPYQHMRISADMEPTAWPLGDAIWVASVTCFVDVE